MAQHDYNIANQSGAAFRSDLNNALAAIVSNNSGAVEPSTTYAYQFWADTTAGVLKQRNAANSAWVTLFQLDGEWSTIALENGTAAAPSLYFKDSGTGTGVYSAGTDQVAVATAGVQRVNFNGSTEVVFNDTGADVDFRIEGDTEPDLFKIDAGTDQVQVKNLNGGPLAGTRNRIINGAMAIDQRNAGASVTLGSAFAYTLDRWGGAEDTDGAATVIQDSSAPAGFTKSLKWTTTTADASLAATQFAYVAQWIEGQNVDDLAWGTASAKSVTLSFWVRSSLTGTFGGAITNSGFNRSYAFSYSISAANTWEYKTVTIPGDTTGTWLTTNGVGMRVQFGLGVGSTYSGTAGSWAAAQYFTATGATSVIGTLNATFYITGVQLEAGTVATPFERRSYGQEFALCQRYHQTATASVRFNAASTSHICSNSVNFAVPMRSTPTVTLSGGGVVNATASVEGINVRGFRHEIVSAASGDSYSIDRTATATIEL